MYTVALNKEQAEKVLKTYFSKAPKITNISRNDDGSIYFITARTVPGNLHTEWQLRVWYNRIQYGKCMFGELRKGEARYDFSYGYSERLMKPLTDACREAVKEWEKGNGLFLEEKVDGLFLEEKGNEPVVDLPSTQSSDKTGYIVTIILLALAVIYLLISK